MKLLDLAHEVGLNPFRVASTHGGEYHSACPQCGGKDRFFIQPNKQMQKCIGYYQCRQCGIAGDTIQFAKDFRSMNFQQAAEYVGAEISEHHINFTKPKKVFKAAQIINPSDTWQDKAKYFIEISHKNIWAQESILEQLNKRGISNSAISKYKIGWNLHDISENKKEWGVSLNNDKKNKLWIPQGIVIPSFEGNGNVAQIKIRRSNWQPEDTFGKYIIITGGMKSLSLVGDSNKEFMIVVESELDAYAAHYKLSDIAFVVAVGSNIKNPDNVVDYLAKQKNILLIYDNDNGGKAMYHKWKQLYPHTQAHTVPFGKDVGEAIEQGLDIRHWVLTTIVKNQTWKLEEQKLICWFLDYIKDRGAMRDSYKLFEQEIVLGPDSIRAQSNELQKGLLLAKQLIEDDLRQSEEDHLASAS